MSETNHTPPIDPSKYLDYQLLFPRRSRDSRCSADNAFLNDQEWNYIKEKTNNFEHPDDKIPKTKYSVNKQYKLLKNIILKRKHKIFIAEIEYAAKYKDGEAPEDEPEAIGYTNYIRTKTVADLIIKYIGNISLNKYVYFALIDVIFLIDNIIKYDNEEAVLLALDLTKRLLMNKEVPKNGKQDNTELNGTASKTYDALLALLVTLHKSKDNPLFPNK